MVAAPMITLQSQAEEIARLRRFVEDIVIGQYMGAGHIWVLDDKRQPQRVDFPEGADVERILRDLGVAL